MLKQQEGGGMALKGGVQKHRSACIECVTGACASAAPDKRLWLGLR